MSLNPIMQAAMAPFTPRFAETSCSQCGNAFGAGDAGYSACKEHIKADIAYNNDKRTWHQRNDAAALKLQIQNNSDQWGIA